MSVLPPPEQKSFYVRQMFDTIAGHYDRLNRLMTFGLDQGWRRYAVVQASDGLAEASGEARALDVGTGTGDFLPLLQDALPDGVIVGVDFSLPMMRAGKAKT